MANTNSKPTAQYGCFLIIPLKYDPSSFNRSRLEEITQYAPLTTMDLNENVKAMMDRSNEAAIGSCYSVSQKHLIRALDKELQPDKVSALWVQNGEETFPFQVASSYLYLFHTRIAFLCLSISFEQMETLYAICNPGFAENNASFFVIDSFGKKMSFSIDRWLDDFLKPLGLFKFFDGKSSFLLDAYAYIFAVTQSRFDTLSQMRKMTFNLHKMLPMDCPVEDDSEEDICYVYAVRNRDTGAYRWGCCVTSQTTAYVITDEIENFEAQRDTQAEDGLPVVLLSLYEKYTCLRFTELIAHMKKGQIKELKNLMLNFQAFGTVTPANLSRWHNVKQIYAQLLRVNDISTAIEDISNKIHILTTHQEEIERAKSETVINIITLFGIVSILASVLSIVQILSGGDILIWGSTILTTVVLVLITLIAVRNRKK